MSTPGDPRDGGPIGRSPLVDLTRDQHGQLDARLLDVVVGRSGIVYARWLSEQPAEFTPASSTPP